MTLAAGTQLGPYEVVAILGTGGMGEVYRARDTKLNREVALKVLPESMASDPQRMARFEREARTLASLNHPSIAAIYGLESSNGVTALVMELVEGETLEERVARSSNSHASKSGGRRGLQAEDSLQIAKQIAEGLEYAHERGIVHRDLKPANVKITPEGAVKVLDFGLAKVLSNDDSGSLDPSNSPTLSVMATQMGIILGTAAYMAPEQAKGKQVDRRADIWAFGCVLYEMLTGKKPFEGETISDILAAVIMKDPDWDALPDSTPPPMQRLIHRCMEKDPKQRLQAIGEARIAIEKLLAGDLTGESIDQPEAVGKKSLPRRVLPWALGTIAIAYVATTAWLLLQPKPAQRMIRFPVAAPENMGFSLGGEMTLSPDGRYLAFVAQKDTSSTPDLWVRPLNSLTATEIPGTEGAFLPFWSPDSQWIGFEANSKLKKVSVSGGAPQTLCDAAVSLGGTWNRNGIILFAENGKLYRVPAAGGTPTLVVTPDAAQMQTSFWFPQFLPDGRHFIVRVSTGNSGEHLIATGSVDSKTVKPLAQSSSNAVYSPPGDLLYLQQSTLMARPFSTGKLKFTGPAVPVAQNVGSFGFPLAYGYFSASAADVLAYQTTQAAGTNQLTWFNRAGQKLGTVGEPGSYANPVLSPDGTRLAVDLPGPDGSGRDIWAFDLKRGTGSRLTFTSAQNSDPLWSHDGSRIYFSSDRNSKYGIYEKPADGLGNTQMVFQVSHGSAALDDLSSDGRYAMYFDPVSTSSVWALPLSGDRKPFVYVQGHPVAAQSTFSPNGQYVAYLSWETGRNEVYVQTFPQHQGKWQISTAGGDEPMWRGDGKELFYMGPKNELMSVAVDTSSSTFQAGTPKPLFQTQMMPLRSGRRNNYVPSPDGQRFLMLAPVGRAEQPPITVVLNWPALLKQK